MINGDIASKVVKLFSRMAQSNIAIHVDKEQVSDLKRTEWQIISLVGCGMSNKEIAGKLRLSEGTLLSACFLTATGKFRMGIPIVFWKMLSVFLKNRIREYK